MNLAWEKVILWILAIIVVLVVIAFLIINLGSNPDSLIGRLFAALGLAAESG